jgi:membrane protein
MQTTLFRRLIVFITKQFNKLANYYQRSFIGIALKRFGENDTGAFAAGLAFYAFFSLFPLFLVLVSVASFLLERFYTSEELFDLIIRSFPLYQDWIRNNIENVLQRRGAIGIVGLITLIWSASSYFNTLVRGLNNAWPDIRRRTFIRRRLVAIGMVAGIILILIISSISSSALELLSHFKVPMGGTVLIYETFFWTFFTSYFPYILTLLVFWLLYYIAPNVKVRKRAAFIGALPASILWNLLNNGFTWYLRSGLVRYEIVYGSLSTIVGLLFWIYLSNLILLLGAYFSAAVQIRFIPTRSELENQQDLLIS